MARFKVVTQPGGLLLYDNERREGIRTWSFSVKNRDEAEALADQMNRRKTENPGQE